MRTSDLFLTAGLSAAVVAIAFGLTPAVSFDGTRPPEAAPVPPPLPPVSGRSAIGGATPLAPVPPAAALAPPGALALPPRQPPATGFEAFRSGQQSLREGRVEQGIAELEVAAKQNVPWALWKL